MSEELVHQRGKRKDTSDNRGRSYQEPRKGWPLVLHVYSNRVHIVPEKEPGEFFHVRADFNWSEYLRHRVLLKINSLVASTQGCRHDLKKVQILSGFGRYLLHSIQGVRSLIVPVRFNFVPSLGCLRRLGSGLIVICKFFILRVIRRSTKAESVYGMGKVNSPFQKYRRIPKRHTHEGHGVSRRYVKTSSDLGELEEPPNIAATLLMLCI
mmetsp:Transcript_8199/g.36571  ORF Transcript_8199/g.36571 Transcript_8199/m.36571 type:complete len:210 (+) Transcript_8199:2549-3178(+)